MSDARERELERRASAGDPAAAALLLKERLRSGRLTPQRLALAAALGHAAARSVLGAEAPALLRRELIVEELGLKTSSRAAGQAWCAELGRHGQEAAVRAADFAARLASGSEPSLEPLPAELVSALATVEAWLEAPSAREELIRCVEAGDRAVASAARYAGRQGHAIRAAGYAAYAAGALTPGSATENAYYALENASRVLPRTGVPSGWHPFFNEDLLVPLSALLSDRARPTVILFPSGTS